MKSSLSVVFFLVLFVGLHNYQVNCASSTEVDDDFSKENGAEDPEPYTAKRANEMFGQNHRSNQAEKSSLTSIRTPSYQPLVELARLTHRGSVIRIYTDPENKNSRIFYDPMAQFDTKSLALVSGNQQENILSFNIDMWNRQLHSKVVARIRSLPQFSNVLIGDHDIHVMPFEEVLLTFNGSSHKLISINNQRQSYIEKKETMKFGLIYDSPAAANGFFEDFRKDPGMMVNSLQLVLEGHGLNLGNQLVKGSKYEYNIDCKNCLTQLSELEEKIEEMETADKENKKKYQLLEWEIWTMKNNMEQFRDLEGKMRALENLVTEKTGNYQGIDDKIRTIKTDLEEKTGELDEKINKIESDVQEKERKIQVLDNKINKIKTDVQWNAGSYQAEFDKKINNLETAVQEKMRSYSFHACRKGDFRDQNSIVKFDHTTYDENGVFSPRQGTFIAPVKGVYFFSFTGLKHKEWDSTYWKLVVLLVKINGSGNDILAETTVDAYYDRHTYFPVTVQTTVLLEKGEGVAVKLMQGWLHETAEMYGYSRENAACMTTFTGFLVEARK